MGYCGTPDIESLCRDVQFVRMSSKGRKTMKLCIQTFTTLLIIVVIHDSQVAMGINKNRFQNRLNRKRIRKRMLLRSPQADADTTLPTTFYPPENPYEDLTETGTAPPIDYCVKATLFSGYQSLNISWSLAMCQWNIKNPCL